MLKICTVCGKQFETKWTNKNICSWVCKQERSRERSRRRSRQIRNMGYRPCQPCIVCGFSLTTDLHHEGSKTYPLCPNHHALITRNIYKIEDILAMRADFASLR